MFLNPLTREYEIMTSLNSPQENKKVENTQVGHQLAQLLTRIFLKGLNRGCKTGMSLNRLNRVYEIRTTPMCWTSGKRQKQHKRARYRHGY